MTRTRTFFLTLLACAPLTACTSAPEFLEAEGALGPYSASASAGGLVFVAGQIGTERAGSFREEAHSAIDRVEAQLARRGLELSDCVYATVYLDDMARYSELNEVYGSRFSEPYPARACIAVKDLPGGARVEIQVVAADR